MSTTEPAAVCSFCSRAGGGELSMFEAAEARICALCVDAYGRRIARARGWDTRAPLYGTDASRLLEELGSRVVGQLAARRAVGAALFEHDARLRGAAATPAPRLLLVGPSGSGKTSLARALRELAAWPTMHTDAGRLGDPGLPCESVEQVLGSLVRAANDDLELASRGAIVLDGIDPACMGLERARSIQRELARLLDGTAGEVNPHSRGADHGRLPMETRQLLVAVAMTVPLTDEALASERALRAALLEAGALEAFLARFDRVVALPRLGVDELGVLVERKLAEVARVLKGTSAALHVAPAAVRVIAESAAHDPDGGWAVSRVVHRMLEEVIDGSRGRWSVSAEDARRLVSGGAS